VPSDPARTDAADCCPPGTVAGDRALAQRTARVARGTVAVLGAASLLGAAASGAAFGPSDRALLQLVFYGCWASLLGGFVGARLGAAVEEDACGEIDMGVTSSMGALLGTASAGLVGTALAGLQPWPAVWGAAAVVSLLHAAADRWWPWRLRRVDGLDARGRRLGVDGEPLPARSQPLRLRDRLGLLVAAVVVVVLGLVLLMAAWMRSGLDMPFMMAAMMYGMLGAMLGGMAGGWLGGTLDEHRGAPEHDNAVMVASMALMAGMMGAMPSSMIGGMMAVMSTEYVIAALVGGLLLPPLVGAALLRGRYRWVRASASGT
jgi:hypothetical protein